MAGEVTTEEDLNVDTEGTGQVATTNNFFQDIIDDPQKRLWAIIGGTVFILLIGFLIFTTQQNNENRGKLVPLVQEIDQSRAFEIVAKLKSVNIEAKVGAGERPGDYVVTVYDKAVESSYLALSRTNLLEDDDYGLFDENDWAASDYDKRIKLTRAINGDLSRIISRMDGLRSAIVRVNIPEQQIFTELQSATTATVQIELLNDGDELSKSQVKSMVNILRGYVPNLEADKISIVDTQGRNYSTFKEEDEADSDFIDEIERVNKLIKKRISQYLDVVLGAKEYEVSVSASITREKIEQQQTTYSKGAVGARQTGSEKLKTGSNPDLSGPGISSNSKNYDSQTVNETLLPSFEQKNITQLPGKISKVTVALAVDKSVPAMISLSQLQESIAAIIGPEASAEDIKLTVVDLHAADADLQTLSGTKPGIVQNITNFFHGGIWSVIMKIFTVIAIIIGLLLAAIIGLNFLSAAANKDYTEEILDPNLSSEFDDVLHQGPGPEGDYGEAASLAQQEALLKEMMGEPGISPEDIDKGPATSYSQPDESDAAERMEFETLLDNFQATADANPTITAKNIQMWLEEDN